jgi:predicted amidohydrolase YtcJ
VADYATLVERLRAAARTAPPGGWVRGVGYHQSVAGDLDRRGLDAAITDRPVRVQHRSGALWILNSAAVAATDLDGCPLPGVERDAAGTPSGRIWRMDAWLRSAVPAVELDFGAVGRRAAAAGLTGVTDATPSVSPEEVDGVLAAVADGRIPQRLHLMSAHDHAPAGERVTEGPYKVLLDERDLPGIDDLGATVAGAHRRGRPVAVHCVTPAQLVVALAAFAQAGARPGDRIEHGAVIVPEVFPDLRRLRLTVVTQPNFVAERGDRYLREVDPADRPHLYRAASLVGAGIHLAAGTDAPFGGPDPWTAVHAAVERRTALGDVLGPAERLAPARALRLFLGRADRPEVVRRVRPGDPADLVLLDRPLAAALEEPSPDRVVLTVIAGEVAHRRA